MGKRLARALMLVLLCAGAVPAVRGAQASWSPPPSENRQARRRSLQKRMLVRGPKMEIGEVVHLATVGPGGGTPRVRLQRSESSYRAAGEIVVGVGDKVMKGDLLYTNSESIVEVLLGVNARVRLGVDTRVRWHDLNVQDTDEGVLTRRRLELLSGTVRARVRQNTIFPTPVLLITVASELAVGLPDYAVPGGVDVVVTRDADADAAVVLNGRLRATLGKGRRYESTWDVATGFRYAPRDDATARPAILPLGDPGLEPADILDWLAFWAHLVEQASTSEPSPSRRIWEALSGLERQIVSRQLEAGRERRAAAFASADVRQRLAKALNRILQSPRFFSSQAWLSTPPPEALDPELARLKKGDLTAPEQLLLHRRLFEVAFPSQVVVFAADPERVAERIRAYKQEQAFSTEHWQRSLLAPVRGNPELSGP